MKSVFNNQNQSEDPIVKGKTSFNISAKTFVSPISSPNVMPNDEEYGYYFYDINAKINHKFSDRSRIYLSVYNGKDHFAANYDGVLTLQGWKHNELKGKYHCFRQMEPIYL